ncbi:MAG: exodeoxyribonuclease VII large subunit [Amaricoccus sp.]
MDLFEEARPGQNAPEFTVSEIAGAVRRVIEGEFGRVRVRGEVGRVSRPSSGHLYLDLKDERSVLAAVIWKGTVRGLAARPEEGMEVIATGRLTTFPGSSKYQMIIEEIAPAGAGALMAMLEKRRLALAAEGLFDAARKRPLPFLPRTIGVITSPSGAVIRDILHRLRERFPVPVLLWPVLVQGERCAPEVAAAIRGFNAIGPGDPVPRPDLLIVARGGGSIEDLWGFNEEIVVRAAAESRIPLISAVGHETDTTLIDFAADRRAPTPTAAAEIAVPVRLDLSAALAGLEERRRLALARGLALRGQRLRDLARGLPRPEALTADRTQRLDALALRLPRALTGLVRARELALAQGAAGRLGPSLLLHGLARRGQRVEALAIRLPRAASGLVRARHLDLARGAPGRFGPGLLVHELRRREQALLRAGLGLRGEAMEQRLHRLAERLEARSDRLARCGARLTLGARQGVEALARTLATLDPEAVVARGYAIVRGADGTVVTRAARASAEPRLELHFADGRLGVRPDRPAPKRGRGKAEPDQGQLL